MATLADAKYGKVGTTAELTPSGRPRKYRLANGLQGRPESTSARTRAARGAMSRCPVRAMRYGHRREQDSTPCRASARNCWAVRSETGAAGQVGFTETRP